MSKKTLGEIITVVLMVLVVLISFPRHANSFQYHADFGRPWSSDAVTAKHSFPIYKTDAQLEADRQRALSSFTPYYQHNGVRKEYILSRQDYNHLMQEGYSRISIVEGNAAVVYPLSEIYTPKTAYEVLHIEAEPTLLADTAMTNKMRQAIIASVSLTNGVVQKGEKIIDRGELVTEHTMQVLASYKRSYDETDLTEKQLLCTTVGDVILVIAFLAMFALFLIVFRPQHAGRTSNIMYFCTLSAILITLVCLEVRYTSLGIYIIPFAWIPILTRIFFDSRTALHHHIITVFIASLVVAAPYEFLMVQMAVGMVVVASLRNLTKRSQLFRAAFYVLLTHVVIYTAFRWATMGNFNSINLSVYADFLINVVLIVCAYGLLYIFERLFGLMSSITLIELTDLNSDLLHEFSEKCPGSFQHAMQVSNLATDAASSIDADSLLVRTAALYHDIGKMAHPECFTENQQDGENPLTDMTSLEAAKLIIGHVEDGVELARKHKLPESVIDFIRTHHGTSLVRYFYNTAVNRGENPSPEVYQYQGPKPRTKEQAILMMADAVEARSRSLKEINEKTLTQMVDEMVGSQIADGQLSDCRLSFADVTHIKQVFIQRLQVINHHRIKYPKVKK